MMSSLNSLKNNFDCDGRLAVFRNSAYPPAGAPLRGSVLISPGDNGFPRELLVSALR
jgi:hypothetical protein